MGRPAGSLVRATCCICGKQEMAPGTSHLRRCADCKKSSLFLPSKAAHAWHPGAVAKQIVSSAVRNGLLPKVNTLTCKDCGAPAAAYDHRDYSKPMQVEPVCARCNSRRGPAMFPILERQASPNLAVKLAAVIVGSQVKLADGIGVAAPEVHGWIKGKSEVPAVRCVQIEQLTKGEVTRKHLRADWEKFWPELAAAEVD